MKNLTIQIEALIDVAILAAINAGREILDVYYNSDFNIETKTDNSPLTIADKRAHKVISDYLAQTEIPVLSEEGKTIPYEERKNWEHFWLVDPLDGTKEFIKRNDEFTVNIALIEKETPVAGVLYVPVSKELYWGSEKGSFKAFVDGNSDKLTNKKQLPLQLNKQNFVVVGSKSHMSIETLNYIKTLETGGKAQELVSKGSALKICMVAEGIADIYPRLGPTMEWDTAAGHAILKFTGREMYQFGTQKPLVYNKENLLNPWFVAE